MPEAPKRRSRPWQFVDARRQTSTERGYDNNWREASEDYRRQHPLCVNHLLRGQTAASECVDHIIPIACCPSLKMEPDNWVALCWSCHSYKTSKEPRYRWEPNPERVVVCGLPGTGKSTWARAQGCPVFDADELGLTDVRSIIEARAAWVAGQRGACIVVVASTVTASICAAQLRGCVKHLTTRHVDRRIRTYGDGRPTANKDLGGVVKF